MERYKHKYTFRAHSGHPGTQWRNVTILCQFDENAKAVAIKAVALRLKRDGHKPAVKWTLELLSVERNVQPVRKGDRKGMQAKPTRPAPDRTLTDGVMEMIEGAEREPRKTARLRPFEEAVADAVEEIRAHDEATLAKLKRYQLINQVQRTGLLIG